MTREEISSLLNERQRAMEQRAVGALMALYADTAIVESPMGGKAQGADAIQRVFETWFSAFPDSEFSSDAPLIDGDRVAQVATVRGTDSGGLMGLAPTGKRFDLPMVHLFTVGNGRILHERRIYDFTGLLVQIGVLKAKPA